MPSERSYMRGEYLRPRTTVLVWLAASMVSAFLLQLVLLVPLFEANTWIPNLFRLTVRGIQQGHVWTLLTHGFLHSTSNPLHVVFSLLALVLIGRELEPQIGPRKFLLLFGGSLLVGALGWLALHWQHGGVHIGPGAGIMGLLVMLACLYSDQRMSFMPFFVFSVTVRPLYFVYALMAIDAVLLVIYEVPGAQVPFGYAPSAHLGGMLAGWIYFRFLHANNGWDRAPGFTLPRWLRLPKKKQPAASISAAPRQPTDLRADVDRILDKINSQGFGSLTTEEKSTLDAAKDLLSKN
jgi:membrane associated rhomboid family serine protease